MLISEINGAKPVGWLPKIIYCSPDCGGEDFDEVEYEAVCPECKYVLDDGDNFCRKCGAKLWWNIKAPEIIEEALQESEKLC